MRTRFPTLVALVLTASVCASADEPEDAAPLLEPARLEAFVDGYMGSYLEQANVAGASVAFIEGENLVLAKGYGYADVEARTPVDPERTLFRIGSVSKLFVWTSVMQLVGEGKLNLLADVNDYLTDIEVPEAYGSHVNMVQLMTHTAGFDERVLGLFATDPEAVRPLREILRDELPARVRPPGELTSYSNHGTALAMLVVEEISGVPWDEYIAANILAPLELTSTSFEQPLSEPLASTLSTGYRFENGDFVARPFELVPLAPMGGASSTATDMARFMMAHLGLGAVGDTRILDEPMAQLMQAPLFEHHPAVTGMAHGLMELRMNGERIVGHGGDTELFHSLLAFFPERGIGAFVSFNTVGASYAAFLQAFVDWRFPLAVDEPEAPSPPTGLGRFAGSYRPIRHPHHTIGKIAALVQSVSVHVDGDHLVTTALTKRRWLPVAPLVFRESDSDRTIAFREDVGGRITHLFLSADPTVAFERAPLVEDPSFVSLVLAVTSFVASLALGFWPASALMRWHYGVSLPRERRVPAIGRWAAWLGSLALLGFAVMLSMALSDPMEVVYGIPPSTRMLFWLPLLAIPLTLVALLEVVRAWRRGRGSIPARVAFTIVVLTMGLFLWQLDVWNLVGFKF